MFTAPALDVHHILLPVAAARTLGQMHACTQHACNLHYWEIMIGDVIAGRNFTSHGQFVTSSGLWHISAVANIMFTGAILIPASIHIYAATFTTAGAFSAVVMSAAAVSLLVHSIILFICSIK